MLGYTTTFTPFKKGSTEYMVMTEDHVLGVCNINQLNNDFIVSCYSSIQFTDSFDELPLVIRMWLKLKRWEQFVKMAQAFDCADTNAQLLYTDFHEHDDEEMLAGPLIATNGYVAVCLAPKVIEYDEFDCKQNTDLSEVLELDQMHESSNADKPKTENP